MRRALPVLATIALTAVALVALAGLARAEGKYARRRAARGETTDTAPKLDRYAFINDEAPEPRQLVLIVDAWPARYSRVPGLVALRIGLSYEGRGKSVPVSPGRFELTWEGAPAPVKALTHEQLIHACGDARSPFTQDLLMLRARAPLAYHAAACTPVFVQFYSDPSLPTLRNASMKLASRRFFDALAYFPVPEDQAKWDGLFTLSYVPADGEPAAVSCAFRIERDPQMQARAMRRARKDLRDEDRHRE